MSKTIRLSLLAFILSLTLMASCSSEATTGITAATMEPASTTNPMVDPVGKYLKKNGDEWGELTISEQGKGHQFLLHVGYKDKVGEIHGDLDSLEDRTFGFAEKGCQLIFTLQDKQMNVRYGVGGETCGGEVGVKFDGAYDKE